MIRSFNGRTAVLLLIAIIVLLLGLTTTAQMSKADNLPVVIPDLPKRPASIRNPITFEQMHNFVGPDEKGKGLIIDLGDPELQGKIYCGPYPFEAGDSDYDYMRFRAGSSLSNGRGVLPIYYFYRGGKYDSNSWLEGGISRVTPTVAYRLDLWRNKNGKIDHLGFYDGVVSFERSDKGQFTRLPTIVDGPYMTMLRSGDPSSVQIAFQTDENCAGWVYVMETGKSSFKAFGSKQKATAHEIEIVGLSADTEYTYWVDCEAENRKVVRSNIYNFTTAPRRGKGNVAFAFVSDSREGVGSGERNYMGSNFYVLSQIVADAYRNGADFFLFGGDLVNGYTSEPEDFRLQFLGWKKAMAGFWRTRPVYPVMGNHEALLNVFDDKSKYGISLDKWPYPTESAEAIFAEQFYNPENGPEPSDPRRPTYKENVYHMQYGPVLSIGFNNNYWWTTNHACKTYGGSPEGYVMDDQLTWIEDVLARAESDSSIRYVFLYAQEPVFPCGGHLKDAMWYNGDNNIRAYTRNADGVVEAETLGMIEVRNRLWKAIAQSSKVAAVLTGDEHEYHRTLITSDTPVGIFPADDTDGDGKLDTYSPNPDFTHPTWHITAGTGGAPFYSRENTPWEPVKLNSHHGYLLFEVKEHKVSMKFIATTTGQVLDEVEDLMAVKARQ